MSKVILCDSQTDKTLAEVSVDDQHKLIIKPITNNQLFLNRLQDYISNIERHHVKSGSLLVPRSKALASVILKDFAEGIDYNEVELSGNRFITVSATYVE